MIGGGLVDILHDCIIKYTKSYTNNFHKVRITHKPTNITVRASGPNQLKNRNVAIKRLKKELKYKECNHSNQ